MKLVIFKDNWADEMNLSGFRIFYDKQWWNFERNIRELEYPYETYFGSNQPKTFQNIEELRRKYTVKDISGEDAIRIRELLGDNFGKFLDYFEEYEDEEDE